MKKSSHVLPSSEPPTIFDKEYVVFCNECGHEVRHLPLMVKENAESLASWHQQESGHRSTYIDAYKLHPKRQS